MPQGGRQKEVKYVLFSNHGVAQFSESVNKKGGHARNKSASIRLLRLPNPIHPLRPRCRHSGAFNDSNHSLIPCFQYSRAPPILTKLR